jgi:hypothetical protein
MPIYIVMYRALALGIVNTHSNLSVGMEVYPDDL